MEHYAHWEYLPISGEKLFTVVLLPEKDGKFPTLILRTPYVGSTVDKAEDTLAQDYLNGHRAWLEQGYAIVYQHCKGQGKSTGAFVPYVHEREDGLALRQWVREQPFYNGELFLWGASYTASLHYATAPFESDIKGAVFEVQDSERYRLWYRNGQMRKGHANWHFALYKNKCGLNKQFDMRSFGQLPLSGLSDRVLGDRAEDFEQMLFAPSPADAFWRTRLGGIDAKDAITDTSIPVLLTTGYNDFYVGGVFKMWNKMNPEKRKNCALLVSPYNHGDGYDQERGIPFPGGNRGEQFGNTYSIDWFNHIRKGTPLPFQKGVITYYRAFENRWESDFYAKPTTPLTVSVGEGVRTFRYDPLNPPAFSGEGVYAGEENAPTDFVRVFTKPFDRDIFIKGQMQAELTVDCNCPDSSYYVRISLVDEKGAYVLRHDIASIGYQLGNYVPGSVVTLKFSFDEYAFLLKKGQRLQIDIAGTDNNSYVCHTNAKGAYALQTGADVAESHVYLDRSGLILPVE